MTRVAVVGAGSWGTTLADLCAAKGMDVVLWAYEPEVGEEINRRHRNDLFLPEAPLHQGITATTDLSAAVRGAAVVVCATPSHAVRGVMARAASALAPDALVISAAKGLEAESHARMSEVLAAVLPRGARVAALSGPTFAREVYERQPTAAAVASASAEVAQSAQIALAAPHLRIYTNDDVVGVELAGALKNVIAIAAGILDGLGIGHNARAALITRGLAEITRLGVALGARPLTFAGLAGMGDLVLTCTGDLSRNRTVGMRVGRGERIGDVLSGMTMVAEGVRTAVSAAELSRRTGVPMPISEQVNAILHEGKDAREAVNDLFSRALKREKE